MKVVTVIGTRPNFIKHSTLSAELRKNHDEVIINTGQHYDYAMSDIFFDEMGIPKPDVDLCIGSGGHGEQTGRMIVSIEYTLKKSYPDTDAVIVHGDTNSSLAGALAASKMQIPVVHIEAGVRSYDMSMPEEINRLVIDAVSKVCCAPTHRAVMNLRKENITAVYTGDVTADVVKRYLPEAKKRKLICVGDYSLLTIHREANTQDPRCLKNLMRSIRGLGQVLYPIHPRTIKAMKLFQVSVPDNVVVLPPLGYIDMLLHMANAKTIITDSGGIQKEAFILGVPCITVRDNTEWPETFRGGMNVLSACDSVANYIDRVIHKPDKRHWFYPGASKNIVSLMERVLDAS